MSGTDTPNARAATLRFRPRAIVEFDEDVTLDEARVALHQVAPEHGVEHLYADVPRRHIEALRTLASEREGFTAPAFFRWITVKVPRTTRPLEFAARLAQLADDSDRIVDVFLDVPAADPSVADPGTNPYWEYQGYLSHGTGINIEPVWNAGGRGGGVRLANVEQGWTPRHEDLCIRDSTPLYGTVVASSRGHGTAVFGIACGLDNDAGIIGAAPDTHDVSFASHNGSTVEVAPAIMATLHQDEFEDLAGPLEGGDVLLIEVQSGTDHDVADTTFEVQAGLPAEVLLPVREAVDIATALGVTVVAAAGNGGYDLDAVPQFDPTAGNDSGAIIVAASKPDEPGVPTADSCVGARIDCSAWGETVSTAWSDDLGGQSYTGYFDGTSAAAAIIAGGLLAVQSAVAGGGQRVRGTELRRLIRGATQLFPAKIRGMPDMGQLLAALGNDPTLERCAAGTTGSDVEPRQCVQPLIADEQIPVVPPIVVLSDDTAFLAANFTLGEALDEALSHAVEEVPERSAELDDFVFFDAAGHAVVVDPVTSDAVAQTVDRRVEVRRRVFGILQSKLGEGPPPPFPETADLPFEEIPFELFVYKLAAALRRVESELDPHRRGWWHRICHAAGYRH